MHWWIVLGKIVIVSFKRAAVPKSCTFKKIGRERARAEEVEEARRESQQYKEILREAEISTIFVVWICRVKKKNEADADGEDKNKLKISN